MTISSLVYCAKVISTVIFKRFPKQKIMEIEASNSDLFTHFSQHSHVINGQQREYSSPCSLSQETSGTHCLTLIGNWLLLEGQPETLGLQLSFEIKFQTIYEKEKNVRSPKLGVKLLNEAAKEICIFFEKSQAEKWYWILGKRINQRGFHQMFRPIRKLGKGNFATVYEAERLSDGLRFAVKAFSKQNSYSAKNGKQSLMNQLGILRQLNKVPHGNVLRLEAVYQSENSIYVVVELLPGQNLYQAVQQRRGQFTSAELRVLLRGLLGGLSHLDSHRILHRDIKPENIMLRSGSLEPVIIDFGLATRADIEQYLFFRCGTPGYVAPEIIRLTKSEHVEPTCDVFSMGAVFHILLARKPLFEGSKYEQVYRNNKQFNIKLEGDHFKDVQKSAMDLLKGMLVIAPEKRMTAKQAYGHQFFNAEEEMHTEIKISSPVLTEVSTAVAKKKKRFIFF